MIGHRDLIWKGDKLMLGTRNTGVKVIPDQQWPKMYRVEYPPGTVSDMANLSRARDAAIGMVASHLNQGHVSQETRPPEASLDSRKSHAEAPQSRYSVPKAVKYQPALATGTTQRSSQFAN